MGKHRYTAKVENRIFVFGSNLAGRHGKGAALQARKFYGAQLGIGRGRTGQSYAIPTKDKNLQTLSLIEIRQYVRQFIDYARIHPELTFMVTAIGTGLAGYKHEDIKPMFDGAPSNCIMPLEWQNKSTAELVEHYL